MERRKSSLDETVERFEKNPNQIVKAYEDLLEKSGEPEVNAGKPEIEELRHELYDKDVDTKLIPKFSPYRMVGAILLCMTVFLNTYFVILVPEIPLEMKDHSHIKTEAAYQFFLKNPEIRKAIMNITAGIQDITLLAMIIGWGLTGTNWQPILSILSFYITKFVCTITFTLRAPEGYLWDELLYPSLTFSSKKEWNFFYSGLVGLNIICSAYLKEYKNLVMRLLSYACCFNLILQVTFFIFIRSNYLIDIVSSAALGHYFVYLSKSLSKYADLIYCLSDNQSDLIGRDELAMKKRKTS